MNILADSTLDKLRDAPPAFWGRVGMVILGIIAVILVIRLIFSMSKVLLAALVLLLFLAVCNWVYQRAEPACMTPFINKISPYFPNAPQYGPVANHPELQQSQKHH